MEMVLTEDSSDNNINWNYVYDMMYPTLNDISKELERELIKYNEFLNDKYNQAMEKQDKEDIQKIKDEIYDKEIGFTINGVGGEIKVILQKSSIDQLKQNFNIACENAKSKYNYKPKNDFTLYTIKEMEYQIRSAENQLKEISNNIDDWEDHFENWIKDDKDPLVNEKSGVVKIIISSLSKTISNTTSLLITANTILTRMSFNCMNTF